MNMVNEANQPKPDMIVSLTKNNLINIKIMKLIG